MVKRRIKKEFINKIKKRSGIILMTTAIIIVIGLCVVGYLIYKESKQDPLEKRNMKVFNIAENLLVSLNERDYNGFVRDFSPDLKKKINKSGFLELSELINSTNGKYIAKLYAGKTSSNGYEDYYFSCIFDKPGNTEVTLVISMRYDSYLLEHVWFDSAALRRLKESENGNR